MTRALRSWRTASVLGLLWLTPALAQDPAPPPPAPAASGETAADPFGETPEGAELDLFQLDTELKAETRVASLRRQSLREVPGVVTIITREEIIGSGASDLEDVLMLVPGFGFNLDVENVIGVSFRGNWAHEGKVLLLIDGQEMNENLYSTLQFGGHYPVENIQRVEVIRGPGSSSYGGYAELAVINVVTRGPKELHGGRAAVAYGQFPSDFARRTVNVELGQEIEQVPGLSASVSAFVGQVQRSDGAYKDFYGNEFPFGWASRSTPAFFNLGANYKDLHVRFLYDDFRSRTRDAYDEALEEPNPVNFRQLTADATYELRPMQGLTITPRLTWTRHTPWSDDRTPDAPLYFIKTNDRFRAQLEAEYEANAWLAVMAGGEAYLDRAITEGELTEYNPPFTTGDGREVSYLSFAGFGELLITHPIANVVVGGRVDHHSAMGTALVPRVAVTRAFDKFHVKALYTRALRAPGIQNLDLGVDVQREYTETFEAEAGYQVSDALFVGANAFDVSIQSPIVYFYDEINDEEGYGNSPRTGTRGVEAEIRFHKKDLWLNANYSFAVANDNQVESYTVAGEPSMLLGMPLHKVALNAGFRLWRGLHFNPSGYFISERYGFLVGDGEGFAILQRAPSAFVLNLFLTYKDAFVEGLNVTAGVRDLLDQAPVYIQPYDGGHAPLPGPRREVLLRVAYDFDLMQ